MNNGHELEIFKNNLMEKHLLNGKKPFEVVYDNDHGSTWPFSFLFEWTSPHQRIILNYGEQPEWYLVGLVYHRDYCLAPQAEVDSVADQFGFNRPIVYSFPSVEDLMKDVEAWKGKEGVCVYSNNGQDIHKVKGAWYLALHRMKEALSSFDKVVDVWFEQGQPSYQDFEKFITSQFDWELWTQCRGDASRICDGAKMVDKIVLGMNIFVRDVLKPLPTRRDQAAKVLSSYGNTNRASFVFKLLDGKELLPDDRKKLLYQVLKK
jgi:hypothetical protein